MNLPIAFPSFSDFSYARGCLPGCHHVNAHVGTLLVVEPYCNGTGNLINVMECYPIKKLILHRVVYSLCLSIILGVSAFGHAYPDAMFFKDSYVPCACILTPSVGVMDEFHVFLCCARNPAKQTVLVILIISLLRDAKQLEETLYLITARVCYMQVLYCLAPAFLRIEMLNCFSATFINSLNASARRDS